MENSPYVSDDTMAAPEIPEINKIENQFNNQDDEISHTIKEGNDYIPDVTSKIYNESDLKLKDRIDQCRSIIESLKNELNDEKAKLEKESSLSVEAETGSQEHQELPINCVEETEIYPIDSSIYNTYVENKLYCDDSLLEYEKQLQKYQNTLNLAQMEKKNAIRKQMLAKAFKLKLMEVENQCNIELIRVKQSLQCLEPLQLIANKWKNSNDDTTYDLSNYDLIPRFPELNTGVVTDSYKKELSESNLTCEIPVLNTETE